MSSTNRSKKTLEERMKENDYFVTPVWAIEQFLEEWNHDTGALDHVLNLSNGIVMDPCAGGDDKYPMSYPTALEKWGFEEGKNLITIDIRQDSRAMIKGDFLKLAPEIRPEIRPDIIITNPPFYLAKEIIEHSLRIVKPWGHVIMLLRLNYFGSQKRGPWFKRHMPIDSYVHSKRMGFYPERPRKTDSIEYMHAVWQQGVNPDHTQLRIIENK